MSSSPYPSRSRRPRKRASDLLRYPVIAAAADHGTRHGYPRRRPSRFYVPLGFGRRGFVLNVYDLIVVILIAGALVVLAHGAPEEIRTHAPDSSLQYWVAIFLFDLNRRTREGGFS